MQARPAATVTINLAIELKASIAALSRQLHDDLKILDGITPIETAKALFERLCVHAKNKQLKEEELITLEEYKLAILNACRASLSHVATGQFKPTHETVTKIHAELIPQIPNLALAKRLHLPTEHTLEKSISVSIDELTNELHLLLAFEEEKGDALTPQQIQAIKAYKKTILNCKLFKISGNTSQHEIEEEKQSTWRRHLQRLKFAVPQFLQTTSYIAINYLELMGAQSILLLIPHITNPVSLVISITLIAISSAIDVIFNLKLFKETYGFSFFGKNAKTFLQTAETELSTTKNLNELLSKSSYTTQLNSNTYRHYVGLLTLANQDVKNKVAYKDSPFANTKSHPILTAARVALLAIYGVMALIGSYYIGTSLVGLMMLTGTTGILAATICLVGALTVIALISIYRQYNGAIFELMNPNVPRFKALKNSSTALESKGVDNLAECKNILKAKKAAEKSSAHTEETKPIAIPVVATSPYAKGGPAIFAEHYGSPLKDATNSPKLEIRSNQ